MICVPLTVRDVPPLKFRVFPLASWRSSTLALISSATVLLPSAIHALSVAEFGTPPSHCPELLQLPLPTGDHVLMDPARVPHGVSASAVVDVRQKITRTAREAGSRRTTAVAQDFSDERAYVFIGCSLVLQRLLGRSGGDRRIQARA